MEENRFDETLEWALKILEPLLSARSEVTIYAKEMHSDLSNRNSWSGTATEDGYRQAYDFILEYDARLREQQPRGSIGTHYFLDILEGQVKVACAESSTAEEVRQRVIEVLSQDLAMNVTGYETFYLYDTYGLPIEFTAEVAAEHGLSVDREGFEALMEKQRERGRAAANFGLGEKGAIEVYQQLPVEETKFLGYETLSATSTVVGLITDGEAQESVEDGQEIEIVLLETPFYGEAGGQVGDTGEIRGATGVVQVVDTVRPTPDLIVNRGKVKEGSLNVGDEVVAEVDVARRMDIARNHTATHLLQAALRKVLGEHVRQSGSLVAPDRLRFDFSHLAPLTRDETDQIQRLVNDAIRDNLPVSTLQTTLSEAIGQGAIALFDEQYGDSVRMVQVGPQEQPFSIELCGGTHLQATGQIGLFHIISESSIGAGLRRIEAVTGRGAEAFLRDNLDIIEAISEQLQTAPADIESKLTALIAERDEAQKRVRQLERALGRITVEKLLSEVESVGDVQIVAASVTASSMEALREMGDHIRNRLSSGVIVLAAEFNDRPNFLTMITHDLVDKGLHAGDMVKRIAEVTGGGGGGRPQIGQAGGRDKGKVEEALRLVNKLVAEKLTS
jgi:alanyl-tRNA synthetase